MTPRLRAAIGFTVSAQLLAATALSQDVAQAPLAGARLDRIAIAAPDADRAAQQLGTLLGIQSAKPRVVSIDLPRGGSARLKTAGFTGFDFSVEIRQPLDASSPTHQFLKQSQTGIEHIGFSVDDPIADRVRAMERSGGTLVLGKRTGRRATVTFRDAGFSVELAQRTPPYFATGSLPPGALGARKVSHVGFVFRDAKPAVSKLSMLLGVSAPALTTFMPIDYRPGDPSDPSAHVRFAQLRTAGVNIEIIEAVGGPSPWMDFVDKGAGGAHHLAFAFGAQDEDFDGIVRHLQARGGRWRKGMRGYDGQKTGSSPEFEFLDTLGIVIEMTKSGN